MMYRYIFDLDNTLIYTNALNNKSYNYALQLQALSPISDCERVTRDIVLIKYPHLNNEIKRKIIELKQEFFVGNIHETKPNESLLKILKSQKTEHCILWTSADETRVNALLEHYKIDNSFKKIIFSNKTNVSQDVESMCQLFGCTSEHLLFHEDNQEVIKKLKELNLNVISI